MTTEEGLLGEIAHERGVSVTAVRETLAQLRTRAGANSFYVYWTSGGSQPSSRQRRKRTLLAFLTPDAALAFAQRNQLNVAERPRLRQLSLLHLIQATLREPSITALLFISDQDEHLPPAGQLPQGVRIERTEIIGLLQASLG